ncbi:MAG: allophanate hydrolase [Actinobacteria bacterium]|nr:allophanate hydrolase [Actinomycetota bacterium]
MTTTELPPAGDTVPIPPGRPTERAAAAHGRAVASGRPEVWITLRSLDDVLADAALVEQRLDAGEDLPLAGLVVAVKDNIDVAGVPTTAACPDFARTPERSATAVQRLVDAGAVVLGKTNMDQFATGLVGTRSPYGAVGASWDPDRIAGGSSSGSAVAVALGLVDLALGTDTAGSGRVPAAFNGIVGVKPTLGLVPTTGVVPACASYDAVTTFTTDLALARRALRVLVGPDDEDPRSRTWPAHLPLAAPDRPRVAVPRPEDLGPLRGGYREAFEDTVASLAALDVEVVEVDIAPLLDAARLLYDGRFVAQRFAAVGAFLASDPPSADPIVSSIILAGDSLWAVDYVDDLLLLDELKRQVAALLAPVDALLLPTTTEHPTIADVATSSVGLNTRLGTYTNGCNLLDLAAVAVPGAPTADGRPFGVSVLVPAFADQVAIDLASRLIGEPVGDPLPSIGVDLAVFGAHLRGQPLNDELVALGARFVDEIETSPAYRMLALDTAPPKPGLVRATDGSGRPIAGERWRLSPTALGTLLAGLPAPMTLTDVELADGTHVVGFGCTPDAAASGVDITDHGGWPAYLAAQHG